MEVAKEIKEEETDTKMEELDQQMTVVDDVGVSSSAATSENQKSISRSPSRSKSPYYSDQSGSMAMLLYIFKLLSRIILSLMLFECSFDNFCCLHYLKYSFDFGLLTFEDNQDCV